MKPIKKFADQLDSFIKTGKTKQEIIEMFIQNYEFNSNTANYFFSALRKNIQAIEKKDKKGVIYQLKK